MFKTGTVWIAKDSKFLHEDTEDPNQTVRIGRPVWQAELCLGWAYILEGIFSNVEAHTF